MSEDAGSQASSSESTTSSEAASHAEPQPEVQGPPARQPSVPVAPKPTPPPTRRGFAGDVVPASNGTDGAVEQVDAANVEDGADGLRRALQSERDQRKADREQAKADKAEADQRAEAAETKRQEMLDGLAQALGFKTDEQAPPDPAELQQSISDRDTRITALEVERRQNFVELAAWRSASRLGANVPALLDSRAFLTSVSALDPEADDFSARVDDVVKTSLEANVAFRANPLPTPAAVGIGAKGGDSIAAVAPGNARIRAAYNS